MLNTGNARLLVNQNSEQTPSPKRLTPKTYVCKFSAAQIKEALIPDLELTSPLDELIATGEAVFEFIHQSQMSLGAKNAFCQLESSLTFTRICWRCNVL